MKVERNYHFDNIKAILIFLVVFGHMISRFSDGTPGEIIYDLIFSFHMPAFIFVSGYFAKPDPKRALAKLVPLYLVFQIVIILIKNIISFMNTGELIEGSFQIFKPEWTLWYLMALIFFQLLLPVFETSNVKHQAAYVIFAVILGILIGLNENTHNFMAMSRIFVFLPFYLLGYYENKNRILERFWRDKVQVQIRVLSAILGVLLIVGFVYLEPLISTSDFYGRDNYDDVGSLIWRLLGWMFALVWTTVLLVWVPKKRVPVMDRIGKNTLPVYLLHSGALLIIEETPLALLLQDRLLLIFAGSVILTWLLSREPLEQFIRKICIPIRK